MVCSLWSPHWSASSVRLLPLLALLAACDAGEPAPITDATGAVYRDGHPWCTATLIDAQTAITAAHCVVLAGDAPLEFAGELVIASHHPGWQEGDFVNDIAILVLARPVVGPRAELSQERPSTGDELQAVGYRTEARIDLTLSVRRVVDSTIAVTPTAGGNICKGDSGGPSFRNGLMVGVHSRSDCGEHVVDEAVAPHLEWLSQVR